MSRINCFISASIIVFLLVYNANSIVFQASEIKKLDPKFVENLGAPQLQAPAQAAVQTTQGSSQGPERDTSSSRTVITERTYLNYYQPEKYPLSVEKEVLSSIVDSSYKTNTVSMVVHIINIGDKPLEDIDIFETVPEDVKIINCSHPIKASSTDEVMRYERKGAPLLSYRDLSNIKGYARRLIKNDSLSRILKEGFSNESLCIFNNSLNCGELIITRAILNELNGIIATEHLYDYPQLCNGPLSRQTTKLLGSCKLSELQADDKYLLNFLILRDLFPSYIQKPDGYIKIQNSAIINENAGMIHIPISSISPRESLLFKYYINVSAYGVHRTNTIISMPGQKYLDFNYQYDIQFPSPKFNVRVSPSVLEADLGEHIKIKYIVDFLNPANLSSIYLFRAHIENGDDSIGISKSDLNFSFINGAKSCNETISVWFNKPGSYNIPSLTIDNTEYFVLDRNMKIEELWHKYIAELSLIILGLCTLIGSNYEFIDKKQEYKLLLAFITCGLFYITAKLLKWQDINIYFITAGFFFFIAICLAYSWKRSLDKECASSINDSLPGMLSKTK